MTATLFQPMHLVLLPIYLLVVCCAVSLVLGFTLWLFRAPRAPLPLATLEEKLHRLAALKDQALITDEEHQAKRRQLIDEV